MFDIVRNDMEVGEKLVPVNSIRVHGVEMAPLENQIVSIKNVVSDEDEIARKKREVV